MPTVSPHDVACTTAGGAQTPTVAYCGNRKACPLPPLTIPIKQTSSPTNHLLLLPLDKLQRLVLPHHNNATALISQIPNPIALLRHKQHLGPKSRADELTAAGLARALGDGFEHVGDGGAVLGVEVGVDFVKKVKGRRVALLDREDEGKGAETCCWC